MGKILSLITTLTILKFSKSRGEINDILHISQKEAEGGFKKNINEKLGKLLELDQNMIRKRIEERELKEKIDPVFKLQNWTKNFVIKIREENLEIIHKLNNKTKIDDLDVSKILGAEEKKLIEKEEEERKKRNKKITITPVRKISKNQRKCKKK